MAGNELIQAQKQVEAAAGAGELARAGQPGRGASGRASAQKDMQAYLKITAPFDGVVTDRLVHPGALVGPGSAIPRCW